MVTVVDIDALLPQTQCGQCSYGGCLPYAEAITKGEAINRCPPGGVKTLTALGKLLQKDVTSYLNEMTSPETQLANIREAECIGCTKCIQACPVDAIIGAGKQLHIVLNNECTGCGLCVPACPVDCIDLVSVETLSYQPDRARQRHHARQKRKESKELAAQPVKTPEDERKAYIQQALNRVKLKKDFKPTTSL